VSDGGIKRSIRWSVRPGRLRVEMAEKLSGTGISGWVRQRYPVPTYAARSRLPATADAILG
jgi:hypothetical protein